MEAGLHAVQETQGTVPCCLCGVQIAPNPANQCANCIRQADVTEGITRSATLIRCRGCGRWHQPPKQWIQAEPESKELLEFCIKRVKGLNKVRLVDAGFLWTEPNSKRIKLKLTVQGEVLGGVIMQQPMVVEFKVERNMCDYCSKANVDPEQWVANVQVRQHVEHKRTLLLLEQLILKHNAHSECMYVRERNDGMDFYFGKRDQAARFVDFVSGVLPARSRHDRRHISTDDKSNVARYRHTFSVEVVPLCKDDLCCLPSKLSRSLGGLGPLVLVTRVGPSVTLTDPFTLRSVSLDSSQYWRNPFRPLMSSRQLVEYVVLDAEPSDRRQAGNKWQLADATVARKSDLGSNDLQTEIRTHLGGLLNAGDLAMGYDLAHANINDIELERYTGMQLPDVVLVRKTYEGSKRSRGRRWKLRRLKMEQESEKHAHRRDADEERFHEEIEEDPDIRSRVAIYRDPKAPAEEPPPDAPQVPLEEMMDGLSVSDTAVPGEGAAEGFAPQPDDGGDDMELG